ncbi:MAG TPA: sulfotransferase family protein [Alphaproteobacteria bacterium]|nr:sulfotransferase family protein [Alphaproteobacteria bacterium]
MINRVEAIDNLKPCSILVQVRGPPLVNRKQRRKHSKRARKGKPASKRAAAEFLEILQDAITHHQAGRLSEAARLYEEILKAAPENTDALHLSGVVAHQGGNHALALERIAGAIAIDAGQPPFHDNLGIVLRHLGRPEEAEASHRKALLMMPDFAAAHHNLGTTLHVQGRFAEAEISIRRALQLDPDNAEAWNSLGNVMRALGRPKEAVDAYRKSLALKPGFVMAMSNLGAALRETGDLVAAEAALRRALSMDPLSADIHNNLGNILAARNLSAGALAAFGRAVELAPGNPMILANRAAAEVGAGLAEMGEATFREVLAIDPDCPEALNGLGVMMSHGGRRDESLDYFRRALAVRPNYVEVYHNMAGLRGFDFSATELQRIVSLLDDKSIPGDNRARLYFSLAEHFFGLGDQDRAFENYRLGNEARHDHMANMGVRFDPAGLTKAVVDRKALFNADFFNSRRNLGSVSELPVFIVGLPRSGTTLIEQIAASHPAVAGVGELNEIQMLLFRKLADMIGPDKIHMDNTAKMDAATAGTLAGAYLTKAQSLAAATVAQGAANVVKRIIDKMPFNYLHLGFIALLFPHARIIHSRRDERDSGLSCYFQNFNDSHPWTTRLADIGAYALAYRDLMAHWRDVLPLPMLEVDYESMIADQEGQSRGIIDFLGLEWDDACLDFHKTERRVRTASNWQVRQPIYKSSVGKWKSYEKHIGPLLAALNGDVDTAGQ